MLMPTLFIGHGSPMYALEPNKHTQAWSEIAHKIPRPSAILMISAHWFTRGIWLTAMQRPNTIHDFSGFPQELFDFQYPAPGSTELALRVRDLLTPAHSNIILEEAEWGLDHGSWSVLKYMYPKANVPVVQMSMDATLKHQDHFSIGQVLQQLRQEGVLIISSGNVVHNLGLLSRSAENSTPKWASGFNDFFKLHLYNDHFHPLIAFDTSSPFANLACPTPEHYLPALYTLGLKKTSESAQIISDGIEMSAISMLSFGFGLPPTQ